MRYLKLREICSVLDIDDSLLATLAEERFVEVKHTLEDEEVVSAEDAERLRFITLLLREMEVNLAGVEVILHMKEEIVALRRQFGEVLQVLVTELQRKLSE